MQNNQEDKLLIAKIKDKINEVKRKNKIVNSDFLNEYQISILTNELKNQKISNYIFYGGFETAERKLLIIYPEKITEEVALKNIDNIIQAIKIELPNENKGKYKHKDYLGTVMSFGLTRERIGDILVYEDKAYLIVLNENAEYIKQSFIQERKFKKSKIETINTDQIEVKLPEFEGIKISINSNRLDNYVSEIAKTSRKKASELIENEFVSVNYIIESKQTKQVNVGDVLIIRGYGKFIVDESLNINKKGKEVIVIKKYK